MSKASSRRPKGESVPQVKSLTDYQRAIVSAPWYGADGKANVHTFLKCRRVGGSEAGALRAIMLATGREMHLDGNAWRREPMDVYVSSKEFRSAKEMIVKVAENCRQMAAVGDAWCEGAVIQGTKVHFPSTGKTIYAVTRTSIRGLTGAVILDEFPHTPRQKELWGAASLVAKGNLGNEAGYPILAIGTPWEAGSFAHQIFTSDAFPFRDNRFVVDIYEAVRQGFPIDPEKAFAELGIPELIETEFLCMWSRGGGSFFPADKLQECAVDDFHDEARLGREAVSGLPADWENAPCFHGVDVGGGPGVSGTGRDFTSIVQFRVIGEQYWIVGVRAFNHLGFEAQCDEVADYVRRYPGEVRIDRGAGGGAQMLQVLAARRTFGRGASFGGVNMGRLDQEKFATKMKRLLEGDQLRLYQGTDAGGDPDGVRALMIELSRIKGKLGGSGHLVLETPRDPLEGHCDRAWAALIGLSAGAVSVRTIGNGSAGYRPAPVVEVDFDHRGTGFG